VPFTGVTENNVPVQEFAVIAVIAGIGLTDTVIVNAAPGQEPVVEVGVIMY